MESAAFNLPENICTKKLEREFNIALEIHAYVCSIKDTVNQAEVIKQPVPPMVAFAITCFWQIEYTYISILKLCAEGHICDCMTLSRTMFENIFQVAYMKRNPQVLGEQWIRYDLIYRIRNVARARNISGSLDKNVIQQVEKLAADNEDIIEEFTAKKSKKNTTILDRRFHLNWTKLSVYRVAEACGLRNEYALIYERACDFVHPSRQTWDRYAVYNEDGSIEKFAPAPLYDDAEVREVLFAATHGLLKIIEITFDLFAIDLPTDHGGMVAKSRELLELG